MKTKNIILSILTSLFLVVSGCNEEKFLIEEPLDFFSPANSFLNVGHFESALTDLYARIRDVQLGDRNWSYHLLFATDIFYNARRDNSLSRFGSYITTLNPTGRTAEYHYKNWYKVVANANTIIDRSEESELTDKEKLKVKGEALCLRAFAYRFLVYLYGGVPLILNEVTSPKTDFVRASKEDILNQMVSDLTEAIPNLPKISEAKDGKVSNLVAQHLLAETYIALQQWDKAINAASVVIDDPATGLMTQRYGSRKSETPGDVYWDLFRIGNQNRSSGNTEALWVAQIEVDVPGGMLSTTGGYLPAFERKHVPASWTLLDPDGNKGFLGYRSDDNVGGRGVSFLRPTLHFENTIWTSDFDNDIRNANHNYMRDIIYDNPSSAWFGQSARDNPGENLIKQSWRWYPWLTKVTTPGTHPEPFFSDLSLKLLKSTAGATSHDWYYFRLAETYLLRAEAYLGKSDAANSAIDINVVRARALANPVVAGDVNIDYILDERARELSMEEPRRLTLQRLGKLVERVRLYNDLNADGIEDYHELWPIPFSEIEANITGDLIQNPGY